MATRSSSVRSDTPLRGSSSSSSSTSSQGQRRRSLDAPSGSSTLHFATAAATAVPTGTGSRTAQAFTPSAAPVSAPGDAGERAGLAAPAAQRGPAALPRAAASQPSTTPPPHPAAADAYPRRRPSPTSAAPPRRSEPRRRRQAPVLPDSDGASGEASAAPFLLAGVAAAEAAASATLGPSRKSPSGGGGSGGRHAAATTPRPRRAGPGTADEELTQLARSLRSEIVGEPFLLTAAFSTGSRGAGSASRPSSAQSAFSSSGGVGGGGGSGDHTSMPRPDHPSSSSEAGTAASPVTPAAMTRAQRGAAEVGRRRSPPMRGALPLRIPELRVTPVEGSAAPTAARNDAMSGGGHSRDASANSGSDSGVRCASAVTGDDDLHSIAELRRRLLTEDFFSSPWRKFQRDGQVPWKLLTSLALCVLLLLQVTWYQLPLARANESMRRAITERFLGDDFDSKGHGDVVSAPTEWMEGLYASVERYVAVYYALSNTSSSDMNYYASPPATFHPAEARVWGLHDVPMTQARDPSNTSDGTAAPPPASVALPASAIAPVVMRVEVDAFSRREGAHHVAGGAPAGMTALDSDWWDWTPSTTFPGGTGPLKGEEEMENGGTRWLTFFVDEAHPLGPFAKYRDAARRLRNARKQSRRQARALRKAGRREAEKIEVAEQEEGATATTVARVRQDAEDGDTAREAAAASAVDAALRVVCTPRLDTLSGRVYRPCASVPAPAAMADGALADGDDEDAPPPSSYFPEFSLMDNVRSIRLEVILRHETSDRDAAPSPRAADGTLRSLLRDSHPHGITGGAVEAEAAVFQWQVAKTIHVRPGGLVETQLHVQTRMWPIGSTAAGQRGRPSHILATALLVLALFELVLRVRALWRIQRYTDRLGRERLAFHARQMLQQQQQQQQLPHVPTPATGQERLHASLTDSSDAPPSHPPRPPPPPPSVRGAGGATATASIPYEWGLPGTPAVRYMRWPEPAPTAAALTATAAPRTYGTMDAAPAAAAPHSRVGVSDPRRDVPHLPAPSVVLPSFLSDSAASPLLVRDTSLSILAAQHPAERLVDADADGRPAGTEERRATGSWLGRQLRRVRRGVASGDEVVSGDVGDPLTCTASPTAAASRGSFRGARLAASPLTPQLTQRIMERSYVDVRTTWRHHLQLSMGTGWHCVGIVAAALTLSYSVLLLLPLLPFAEVAQDGAYDAWTSVLLGTAALTSCVLLLSYLRFFPTLYFPILASTHVLPKLFLFALCVAPLFFGFAVFFIVAFGPYSEGHFSTLGWASMGLYLMTYGDSLLDTVAIISDTPYTVTAVVANVMVIVFALLFMTIMLNIAMTITQHEWLRLRRRFGAALSSSSLLFAVRSREEVKAEAVEAIRTNLEVLWFMLAEEEEEEKEDSTSQHHTDTAAPAAADSSGSDSDFDHVHVRIPQSVAAFGTSVTGPVATSVNVQDGAGGSGAGRWAEQRKHHSRRHRHDDHCRRRGRRAVAGQRVTGETSASSSDEEQNTHMGSGHSGGGGAHSNATGNSSYDASVATTVPPE